MRKLFMLVVLLAACAAPTFARERLYGWCELGAQTPTVQGFPTSIKVQGSFPPCTLTVYKTGSQSVQTGRYVSGGTITGTAGQTITLFINGGTTGATATATLTGTNTISLNSPLIINTPGAGYSGPPTTATCSSATATCTGTVTITTTVIGTLATIYADNNGTPLSNPFSSNVQGYWYFYVDDSTVDVQESAGGLPGPFTLGAVSANDPYFTQTGGVPVTKRSQALLNWNVQQFGCMPDGATDVTACITTAAQAAQTARATLSFPPNPINGTACYIISKAVLLGTAASTTFVDFTGSSQPLSANNPLPVASCIQQTNQAQDIFAINYAIYAPSSVSIKNLNLIYSPIVNPPSYPGQNPPVQGHVTVSGNVVSWVSGQTFLTTWYQSGGNASIYIHGAESFGCPGNICNITGVGGGNSLTIAQTCASGCPVNQPYTVGVAVHAINNAWQTAGWVLDQTDIVSAGVGFSSDGGTQSNNYRNGTFWNNYIGYNGNGDILPHFSDWYFQAGVNGMVITQTRLMLSSKLENCVFESQTGPAVTVDTLANIPNGSWEGVWFEFPQGDIFHVLGTIYSWTCTGCSFDLSSLATSVFVVMGNLGQQASMNNITLAGGYVANLNGGYVTVAENLAGVPTDPTSSSDPSFFSWNLLGFGTFGGTLRGFQPPDINGAQVTVVMHSAFRASQLAISTVFNQRPTYVLLGSSNTGQAILGTSAPPYNQEGLMFLYNKTCVGPGCFPTTDDTLTIHNALSFTGTANTATGGLVTWETGGQPFNYQFAGQQISINSVNYAISYVQDANHLVVSPDPGNQTGVPWSVQGSSRTVELAGPGQAILPTPLHEFVDGNNIDRFIFNHDGYPSTNTGNNSDTAGNLALLGTSGPGGSGVATFTFVEPISVATPFCNISYAYAATPGALATVPTGYSIAVGPPSVLTMWGQTGLSVTWTCIKADR